MANGTDSIFFDCVLKIQNTDKLANGLYEKENNNGNPPPKEFTEILPNNTVIGFIFSQFNDNDLVNAKLEIRPLEKRVYCTAATIVSAPSIEASEIVIENGWYERANGENIYVSKEYAHFMDGLRKTNALRPTNALFLGPSGVGKTSVLGLWAEKNGYEVVKFDCANPQDATEVFGYSDIHDGTSSYVLSEETLALMSDKKVVAIFDEINRAPASVSNVLFPLLDGHRYTKILGKIIRIGRNVLITATANIGWKFAGTFALDEALKRRFGAVMHIDFLPYDIEKEGIVKILSKGEFSNKEKTDISDRLMALVSQLRQMSKKGEISIPVSTDETWTVANYVLAGIDLRSAMEWVYTNKAYEEEERKVITDAIKVKNGNYVHGKK